MSTWRVLLASVLGSLLVSCQHAPPPGPATPPTTADGRQAEDLKQAEHRELLKAASQRLDEVRKALDAGRITEAEAGLQPLVGQGLYEAEISELRSDIRAAKDRVATDQGQQQATRRALTEVEQGFTLPTAYGSTVTIDGLSPSIALPPGPMEDLFKRRVDISIENAGVKELVQALTQIEGLNIIADDALEAEKALTVRVRNTPLSEILGYIARNMGVAFHLGENVVWVTESTEPPGAGPKLETQVYRLRQGFIPSLGGEGAGSDTDLEDALESIMADSPEGASYRVFKNRNLLMVRNTRENLRLVEQLVVDFDRPPQQVLIEARFLTISRSDLFDVGVELRQMAPEYDPTIYPDLLKAADNPDSEVSDFLTELGAIGAGNADGVGLVALSGIIGNRTYDLIISALDRKGSTKTLNAPRVTVLNNQTARIRKGDTTLYYDELETVAASGGGDGGSAAARTAFTGTPKELELGMTFEVKVNVGNDAKTVLLDLRPEVITLKGWRRFNVVAGEGDSTDNNDDDGGADAAGTIELPETTENTVQTRVAVNSGETVVLGGMIESVKQNDVRKVPILGDIPFIGFFFRHTTERDDPKHLLIFVTAKVIDASGQYVEVRNAAP